MAAHLENLKAASAVSILGFGREGQSFLRYCSEHGGEKHFTIIDDRALSAADLAPYAGLNVTAMTTAQALAEGLGDTALIFRSPGISIHTHPVLKANKFTPVTTSVNLWMEQHASARVIAVSGTKGKSTTASLLHHLLRAMGRDAVLGGNIGVPPLDITPGRDETVLELSSYQIADLSAQPDCALLLNLYPEHIDWHGSLDAYYRDKCRLINELAPPVAIVNGNDKRLLDHLDLGRVTQYYGRPESYHLEGDDIYDASVSVDIRTPLPGRHNAQNTCAVLEVMASLGVIERAAALPDALLEAASNFTPLKHRLEEIGARDGRLYVNDSISTTPETTLAALSVYRDRPVSLILGGYDRGQDYAQIIEAVSHPSVHALFTLPDNGARISAECRASLTTDTLPKLHDCSDLEEAVVKAATMTPQGGVILLSPGAPSYGHFRNFEDRGNRFRELSGLNGPDPEGVRP